MPAESSAAKKLQLAVVQITSSWRILLNGERIGRFRNQADAVECVMAIAASEETDGFDVEVLVQDVWGEVRPVLVS